MASAFLVLDDGRIFEGTSWAATGKTFGEAVFQTGMTGYQETLTDPSYHKQVVIMTAPHIGNTGVNDADNESAQIWVAGFVVRNPSSVTSNWRAQNDLEAELIAQGIVGIQGVDTRAITRHLRDRGSMCVGIFSGLDLSPIHSPFSTETFISEAAVTAPNVLFTPLTFKRVRSVIIYLF